MTSISITIPDVQIKELKTYGDDRGFFREVIRVSDPLFFENGFAQWSHSRMVKNVVKAWHYHHVQYDWWYIPFGVAHVALVDHRKESPAFGTKMDFIMGDKQKDGRANEICVKIPPGVLHGCRVLSDEAALFYITSQIYNPQDEGRIPFDATEINHSWGEHAIVSENDTKFITPVSERKVLAGGKK